MIGLLRRLRAVLLRGRLDREMREEMEAHLERATDQLMARGLSQEEARRQALREFGNVAYLQELGRDARGSAWLGTVASDARFALRRFLHAPLSTATILLLLTLGIGANTGLFTLAHSILTRPAPGIAPDEALVRIRGMRRVPAGGIGWRELSYPEVQEYARHTEVFEDVAAWENSAGVLKLPGGTPDPLSAGIIFVDDGYLDLLGVQPILGRLPTSTEHAPPSAMIDHGLWNQRFGGDPRALGRTLDLDGVTVTITAVAPPRFGGVRGNSDIPTLWLPLSARAEIARGGSFALSSPDSMFLSAVGRLAPGVDAERATTVVSALASSIVRLPPSRGEPGADVVPLRAYNSLPGTSSSPAGEFATLGAFTLMLLLLTCTNVGTLQIGLAALRRREIGVRLSLGASRARLIRQLLTESGLLALAASALSLGTVGLLVHLFSEYVRDVDVVLAWPVLIFTLGVGLLAAVVFGLSPALQATRISVSETLKVSATWGSSRSWLQRALVVAQVGLTQPLLLFMVALSLLFLRELRAQGDSGLDDRIVSVAFNVFAGASTFETRAEVVQRLQERLTALPAVVSAIPQTVGHPIGRRRVHPADRTPATGSETLQVAHVYAASGYFEMMGINFLYGRDFDASERNSESLSIVIGNDLARELWGSENPIGRRFVTESEDGGEPEVRGVVVGVVDERDAGGSRSGNFTRAWAPSARMASGLLVRTTGPAGPVIPIIRSIASQEAPDLPVSSAETLASARARERTLIAQAVAGATGGGLLALLLSSIGLYALMAFTVVQRRREIGIRRALGAGGGRVTAEIFLGGLRLSAFGIVLGLPLGFLGMNLLRGLGMPEVPWPLLMTITSVLVLAVTSLATFIPASRASRVDPARTLRFE